MIYYIIYQVCNTINGKIYIGAHATNNLNDGYMGSGTVIKKAIKKYGKDVFLNEVLYCFDNEVDMYAKEATLVTENFCNQKTNYNMKSGGIGSIKHSIETKIKMSENHPYKNKKRPEHARKMQLLMTGKKKPIEQVEKQRNSLKLKYKNGFISPTLGIKRPDLVSYNKQQSERKKGLVPVYDSDNIYHLVSSEEYKTRTDLRHIKSKKIK